MDSNNKGAGHQNAGGQCKHELLPGKGIIQAWLLNTSLPLLTWKYIATWKSRPQAG